MKLSDIIFENESHYRKLAKKLEDELRDTYNRDDIHVSMGAYAGGRSARDPLRNKGFGRVEIMQREDLPDSEYRNMKTILLLVSSFLQLSSALAQHPGSGRLKLGGFGIHSE